MALEVEMMVLEYLEVNFKNHLFHLWNEFRQISTLI